MRDKHPYAKRLDETDWWAEKGQYVWSPKNTLDPHELITSDSISFTAVCPKCGFEYPLPLSESIYSRTDTCPICSGRSYRRVIPGYNDLSQYPEIALDWDEAKNGYPATDIYMYSHKKSWFRCHKCGYEWATAPYLRTRDNHGCPHCAGRIVIPGVDDLPTLYPDLMTEWCDGLNGPADGISPGTRKKFFWKCHKCGYEWKTAVNDRTNGHGCPHCSGRVVIPGVDDLPASHPDLMKEWVFEANGPATGISPGSHKKCLWKCQKCGYEWRATIANRTKAKTGCAHCAGQVVFPGVDDLPSLYPDLMKEWVSEANGPATGISPGSHKKYLWKCHKCGYEWRTSVVSRTKAKTGCAHCSGHIVLPGVDDLPTLYPDLTKEWVHEANGKPDGIHPGSNNKYLWKCRTCGYEWESTVKHRTEGHGCPRCAGNVVWEGHTDIATTHPLLSSEWHPSKNGDMKPSDFSCGSEKKVYWLGPCGHEWKASIANRALHDTGCPICHESRGEKDARTILNELDLSAKGYEFAEQWTHITCRSPRGRVLRFDFAVLSDSSPLPAALIEVQGGQHYEPVDCFGGDEVYEQQFERDKIKREWCQDNDIPLMEICYIEDQATRRHNLIGFLTTIGVLTLQDYERLTT